MVKFHKRQGFAHTVDRTTGATKSGQRTSKRVVACPECNAEVGEPCLTSTGHKTHNQHRSRVRLAFRYYEDLEQSK